MYRSERRREEGQGLVEYGLILVLVSIVAVSTISLMSSQVNEAFTTVNMLLSGSAIRSATAERTGGGNGNDIIVTVSVDRAVTIVATDLQSNSSKTVACNNVCTFQINGVGHSSGTVTVGDGEGTVKASYSAKP